ncbi:hypothetical protein D3C75_1018220 [compost metagenome]
MFLLTYTYLDTGAQSLQRSGHREPGPAHAQHHRDRTVNGEVGILNRHHQCAFRRRNRVVDRYVVPVQQLH